MKIEFSNRELTIGEMVLAIKAGRGDVPSAVEFLALRATNATREQIDALPMSEWPTLLKDAVAANEEAKTITEMTIAAKKI